MRPSAIHIPGGRPRSVEDFMDRARGQSRQVEKPKPRFVDSNGRTLEKPGVQGYAAIYNTTFWSSRGFVFLQEGCLTDSIYKADKKLLLDHNEAKQVGSSATGLEFANTSSLHPVNGLAFRMPLSDDNSDSELIYNTINRLERPCVSVGLAFEESETVTVDGLKVDVVIKARIEEISLVKEGAVPGTNATIVDLSNEDTWLFMAARSPSFIGDKYVSNVQAAAQRIVDRLRALTR